MIMSGNKIDQGISYLEKALKTYSSIEISSEELNTIKLDLANAYISSKQYDQAQLLLD